MYVCMYQSHFNLCGPRQWVWYDVLLRSRLCDMCLSHLWSWSPSEGQMKRSQMNVILPRCQVPFPATTIWSLNHLRPGRIRHGSSSGCCSTYMYKRDVRHFIADSPYTADMQFTYLTQCMQYIYKMVHCRKSKSLQTNDHNKTIIDHHITYQAVYVSSAV